jgi:hypothetical protein
MAAFTAIMAAPVVGIFGGPGGPALSALVIMGIVIALSQAGFCGFHVYMSSREFTTMEFILHNAHAEPVRGLCVPAPSFRHWC